MVDAASSDWLTRLLEANRRGGGERSSATVGGSAGATPRRAIAIVACMDVRLEPVRALGLRPGDAHVLRNAGGRVTDDVERSLLVSSWLLGTRTFLVIHHTDCGMAGLRDRTMRDTIRGATDVDVGDRAFLGFADLDRSVDEDVAKIRAIEGLPDAVAVAGLVYDVETGLVREVGPAA